MQSTYLVLALVTGLQGSEAKTMRWDFEDAAAGKLPRGWTATQTGKGEGSVWKVVEDKSAPKGSKVLAQTAEGPRPLFNLCVADKTSFKNVKITVAFKAIKGKIDQGGGIVWRCLDANNYYIARYNPLENNYRLYKVVDGKRIQLETKEGLKVPAGEWHTLTIRHMGDRIECLLDGKKELEHTDSTFQQAGQIGLWTKADAHTYFDALHVTELKE